INGVLVNLRDTGGSLLAQVRTGNATGISQNYRFYVQPFAQYTVEIDPSNFTPGGILAGYGPTLANAAADDADSDLDTQNRIAVPAGPNRDLTMTFDAGFAVGANVRIDKSAPASAAIGTTIVYSLTYTNQGPSSAANVTIRDDLPGGLTVLSASPPASSSSGQTLTWSLGTLAPGASGVIQVSARVEAVATSPLTNRATITTTTVGDDPNDNSDTTTTTVLRAGVEAAKSGPASVVVGSRMAYTLRYSNTGSAPASAVQLVGTLPAGLTFVSASPPPSSVSGQTLTWTMGTVAAGASGSIALDVQVAGAIGGTDVANQLCVSTSSPGATPANACATAITSLQR
ncbi:MAG TPA: DUF11 domain-containing protein, partial [Roseiflexaceae bacterium]|nr:DUF11 domain-containing protein [Roseiflexaceae bacterium]